MRYQKVEAVCLLRLLLISIRGVQSGRFELHDGLRVTAAGMRMRYVLVVPGVSVQTLNRSM